MPSSSSSEGSVHETASVGVLHIGCLIVAAAYALMLWRTLQVQRSLQAWGYVRFMAQKQQKEAKFSATYCYNFEYTFNSSCWALAA